MENKSIEIDKKILNKYKNAKEMIRDNICNFEYKINVKTKIEELNKINLENMSATEAYHLATKIFKHYNKNNIFDNKENKIIVSNGDIKESINKIYHNNNQKKVFI